MIMNLQYQQNVLTLDLMVIEMDYFLLSLPLYLNEQIVLILPIKHYFYLRLQLKGELLSPFYYRHSSLLNILLFIVSFFL